jgi:cell division protein FtsB
MRILAIVLCALLVLIQYPLWLGKGGWMRVWDLDRQVAAQKETNHKLEVRNQALDADVRDLKQGTEAIEERARYELGMIRQDEVFFQLLNQPYSPLTTAPGVQPASAPAAAPQSKAQPKH